MKSVTFDKTLWKTNAAQKNLGLTEKNRFKNFFRKTNDRFGFPDPDCI